MKTTLYTFILLSFLTFFFFNCEKGNEEVKNVDITGSLKNHTVCKTELKSGYEAIILVDTLSKVDYSYNLENKKLTLNHINAGFNCCFDSLYCNIQHTKDSILIEEVELNPHCKCDCLYDLHIEINNVAEGTYQIKFIEPNVGKMEKIIFELDLKNEKTGYFCIIRKQYPWGQ